MINIKNSLIRSTNIAPVIALSVILCVAFLIRIEPISYWNTEKEIFFSNDEPVLANVDGYYYLQLAKEIKNDTYSPIDVKRAYPEHSKRNSIPSLLSVTISLFSSIFDTSLNWIGIWLPVMFGLCIFLPVLLFSNKLGGYLTAIGSISFVLFSPYYMYRTRLGWLDTDCLNVFFPLMAAYLSMCFGLHKDRFNYLYLLFFLFTITLFYWWWDTSPAAVSVLCLSPLALTFIFHYRPGKHEYLCLLGTFLILIIFLVAFWGLDKAIDTLKVGVDQLTYISGKEGTLFPNIGSSIQEQQNNSFLKTLLIISPSYLCLTLAIIGAILLFFKQTHKSLYLIPLFIIGCLSFFFAKRFTIFLTPILALGFGYFFQQVHHIIKVKYISYMILIPSIILFCWSSIKTSPPPKNIFNAQIINGMQKIADLTPDDAVIWSWWDEGHPLVYWSNRATLSDGMIHGGARSYFTAFPLATNDHRLAANFMSFYAARGVHGINQFVKASGLSFQKAMEELKHILQKGPDYGKQYLSTLQLLPHSEYFDLLKDIRFYYPDDSPPIYLFLDSRILKTFRWIYWLGSWNTIDQSGDKTLPMIKTKDVQFTRDNTPTKRGLYLDVQNGFIRIDNILDDITPIKKITNLSSANVYIFDHQHVDFNSATDKINFSTQIQNIINTDEKFSNIGEYEVVLDMRKKELILVDGNLAGSMLYQLSTYKNCIFSSYFEPINIDSDFFLVWKVNSDKYSTTNKLENHASRSDLSEINVHISY
ncbi:STT3 domain-containing protein [Desulforhopalus singaporensis]|uniref:Dolichyl-diphosphooligosaccharide--protein glycosyltransferase n=1 Tax=Desulforhopalus singaporensis TaxID=91360 RepID=A0A1H0QRW8_9BACT|nr:STT3 domain-containing protein [Desulforhopalus singaporensis]SDP19456.1 hypothetical protein SAMN05660330_02072 [Desulforhopalus singaporensis]